VAAIRERIEAVGGRITFAEFMELALYHPEHGYYRGDVVRSAREGDFLTAGELHPIFARVVASQVVEMWELLDRPGLFTVREYGAGPGTLGLGIIETVAAERPDAVAALGYDPIELNAAHRRAIAERFAAAGHADALVSPGDQALVGCVIANEFVDAFPVHRVRGSGHGTGGDLEESYVAWRDGRFIEEWAAPSMPELTDYLQRVDVALEQGQIAEIDLAVGPWLAEVAAGLERGYLLVIDYGHPAHELYSTRRFAGTLLGYRGHAVVDDPLVSVGRQDLTAHVDFTTLSALAQEKGLDLVAQTTQARFLVDGGLERRLNDERERPDLSVEGYLALRSSIGRLLDPRALGGFGVLLFGRDVPHDRLPSGFASATSVSTA
jgi:SAM-dependent MidA family methyltransferase